MVGRARAPQRQWLPQPLACNHPTAAPSSTGEAPNERIVETLHATVAGARAALAAGHARTGAPVVLAAIDEHLRLLHACITIAYPAGLPDHDAARLLLAEDGGAGDPDRMDPATAELWWAGAPFPRGGVVSDRVGKNDKTKVVARLQRAGAGAPVREPVVSDAERTAMTAWYFKKQEEAKALAEDGDEGYLQQRAAWADPRALKAGLLGTTTVSWRAGGRA